MKTAHYLIGTTLAVALFAACNSKTNQEAAADSSGTVTETVQSPSAEPQVVAGSYKDLSTGKEVYIVADPETGYAMDSIAKIPVEFYINTSGDTLYKTGLVVNDAVINDEGTWKLDDAKIKVDGDKIKIKDGDTKIKIDGDEMKVKDGDYKKKVDGEDSKEKNGDYKKKVEGEDVKVKSGDSKTKVEDGKVKVKNDQ